MEKASDKMNWKTALLSSGIPLELEAGRVLVSKGFAVNSNYSYDQSDTRFVKDVSVDLHAKTFAPFFQEHGTATSPGKADKSTGQLELLVECRHRHSDAVWFFLPDPNPEQASPLMPGSSVRVVDKFSSYVVESGAAVAFDAAMPVCQKGLEVDTTRGHVDEGAFRQGLSQLQYAIPRLLTENILCHMEAPTDKNIPFFFCPVLLTNSKLLVLDKEVSTEAIESSSRVQDVSSEAPYLLMHLDYSKDFELQCVREISRLGELQKSERAMSVERKRAGYYGTQFNLPFTIMESLIMGDRLYMDMFFTRFVICNSAHFPEFVDAFKDIAVSALEGKKLIR